MKSFRTAFNNLLKACGFEYDAQSQKHAITSLRHTYATIRLEEGTAIEALASRNPDKEFEVKPPPLEVNYEE